MKAVICPVCNGSGKYGAPEILRDCHGCGGKGWVEVQDSYPYVPYVPHPCPCPCPQTPYTPYVPGSIAYT